MNSTLVRRWIEGFEAARQIERTRLRAQEPRSSWAIDVSLPLIGVALAALPLEIKARRKIEDDLVLENWCRLKARHRS